MFSSSYGLRNPTAWELWSTFFRTFFSQPPDEEIRGERESEGCFLFVFPFQVVIQSQLKALKSVQGLRRNWPRWRDAENLLRNYLESLTKVDNYVSSFAFSVEE